MPTPAMNDSHDLALGYGAGYHQFVTVQVGEQRFGIPVMEVRDVLRGLKLTRVPLAPKEIAGSMNLRGRIVTAIDMRARLGLPPYDGKKKQLSVVVDHSGELYSLIVDSVGDVLSLSQDMIERTPSNMNDAWKSIAAGVFRLETDLLMIIDVDQLLQF